MKLSAEQSLRRHFQRSRLVAIVSAVIVFVILLVATLPFFWAVLGGGAAGFAAFKAHWILKYPKVRVERTTD